MACTTGRDVRSDTEAATSPIQRIAFEATNTRDMATDGTKVTRT